MSTRLAWIELEQFRGFRDKSRLSLDADVVLIRGDNGSGKTSIADGALWLLTGQLPHLEQRAKGRRNAHDPIVNRYSSGPCRVSMGLRVGPQEWTLQRTGSGRGGELEAFLDGQPAETHDALNALFGSTSPVEVADAVSMWGILRQDAIRVVLDTGGAALHERMTSVIGLEQVSNFREACRAAHRAAQGERREAESSLGAARERASAAREAIVQHSSEQDEGHDEVLRARLARQLPDPRDSEPQLSSSANLGSIGELEAAIRSISQLRLGAREAAEASLQLQRESPAETPSIVIRARLLEGQERLDGMAQESSDMQALAEAALPLLSAHCPVCEQTIDAAEVRAKLLSLLALGQSAEAERRAVRERVAQLTRELDEATEAEARLNRSRQQADDSFAALDRELTASGIFSGHLEQRDSASLSALLSYLGELQGALEVVVAESAAAEASSRAAREADLTVAKEDERRFAAALVEAKARESRARELADASQTAEEQIVAQWLRELEPSFAEVFDRLAPHPTFTRLRAKQDNYYKKSQVLPEVWDPVEDVLADPTLVYSEGQLNTVALSYFLGLALSSDSPLTFTFLDDPLQSMDVLAVLGFADLCRHLRRTRQTIITTHDRRYADVLARKLDPREPGHRTIVHELDGWSRSGPVVQTALREFGSHSAEQHQSAS